MQRLDRITPLVSLGCSTTPHAKPPEIIAWANCHSGAALSFNISRSVTALHAPLHPLVAAMHLCAREKHASYLHLFSLVETIKGDRNANRNNHGNRVCCRRHNHIVACYSLRPASDHSLPS